MSGFMQLLDGFFGAAADGRRFRLRAGLGAPARRTWFF